MTLTPLHPIPPRCIKHVAHAAAKTPFVRGPGTTCYTLSDVCDRDDAAAYRPPHHGHGLQIDVDPIIEEAWEAAMMSLHGAIEGPSKAIKEGSASLARKAHEVGGSVWKSLEPSQLPWSRDHSPSEHH